MGAEARTGLSLERCTQQWSILDLLVVEEYARHTNALEDWERVSDAQLVDAARALVARSASAASPEHL